MSGSTATFKRVLDGFIAKLSPEDQASFGATTLQELERTIVNIQQKQKSTRTMQNLTRISGFLEAIKTYEKVIEVFVNVHNMVAFVWVSHSQIMFCVSMSNLTET